MGAGNRMVTFGESGPVAAVRAEHWLRRAWRIERWLRWIPLGVTLAGIGAVAIREARDPDLWWHLATGRYIVAERRIPTVDVFSYTAFGRQWVTHEWLSDLLLYGGYRAVGLAGLILFFAALVTASFGLVYFRCRSSRFVAAFSVLLAAGASAMTWGVRPQMFSLFFASLYLYILETGSGDGAKRVWVLPVLTLLWANLHSGFVTGLAIIAVVAVGRELSWLGRRGRGEPWVEGGARRLALVGLLSLGCSLITPNGVSAAMFPFGTLSNHIIQAYIQEWFSPDFHQIWAWPLAVYLLALLATGVVSRRRASASQVLLLLGSAAAGLYSVRHVPFLSLVGAPLLAEQAEDLRSPRAGGRPARPVPPAMRGALGLAVVALAVAIGVQVRTVFQRNATVEQEAYPAAALAYMREQGIDGRIFNAYHWGGYLIWHGYPVFADGRAEVYGDEILGQYLKAHAVQPDWEAPLLEYGVDAILIETDSSLAVILQEGTRWRAVYRDEVATLFVPAGLAGDSSVS